MDLTELKRLTGEFRLSAVRCRTSADAGAAALRPRGAGKKVDGAAVGCGTWEGEAGRRGAPVGPRQLGPFTGDAA